MKNEKKKTAGRIFTAVNIVLCIILIPVILLNVTVIISTYIHPDEIPGFFGIKPVAVLSGSMENAIMTGDLILIKNTDPLTLEKGDVICYLEFGQAVTHRIVEIVQEAGEPAYITKGDANNTEDARSVRPEQIQGVWSGVRLAGVGNFVLFLSSTTGMIVFIVCPILLLILWDIISRLRMDKKERSRTARLEAELNALKAAQEERQDSGDTD